MITAIIIVWSIIIIINQLYTRYLQLSTWKKAMFLGYIVLQLFSS